LCCKRIGQIEAGTFGIGGRVHCGRSGGNLSS
jgi:hypothetical protein